MKVLVAEDTKSNLLYLKEGIEDSGHKVVTARNGREAVEKFNKEFPDLVILDVVMPEMDGITAAREIRKKTESQDHWVPIIFISAIGDDDNVIKGLGVGGDDYIIKPVSQPVLKAKLNAMERIYKMQVSLDQINQKLKQLSELDSLTGIANRRKFDQYLLREYKRAGRNSEPLTLALVDVDHFKSFNDNYGHSAGDDALLRIANCLSEVIRRPGDLVARYGGEEFALILPETNSTRLRTLLDKTREAVEKLGIKHEFSTGMHCITVSIGSMTIFPGRNFSEKDIYNLIVHADQALYKAKELGRNKVVIHPEV